MGFKGGVRKRKYTTNFEISKEMNTIQIPIALTALFLISILMFRNIDETTIAEVILVPLGLFILIEWIIALR